MKILILTPWCDDLCLQNVKGIPLNACLINKLLEREHKLEIFCVQGDIKLCHTLPLHKLNLPYISCPGPFVHFINIFLYFYHNFLLYNTLRKKVYNNKYDLILNIAHLGTLAIKRLSVREKIPFVLLVFGIFDLRKPFLPAKLIPYFQYISGFLLKPDKIITINDGSAPKDWLERTLKIPSDKIVEVANPRPLWSIEKKQGGKNIMIGYFSRFNYEKRTDLFIKIAYRILEKETDVNFIIAGSGALAKEIQKLQAHFPGRVVYKGWLDYNQMCELYKEIDILISTARYANGVLPVIEAQSCGIPVVAFNIADTKRFILDGKTGFLTSNLTVDEFVSKISILMKNKELREKMGNSAKEFTLSTFPDTEEWANFIVTELEKLDVDQKH